MDGTWELPEVQVMFGIKSTSTWDVATRAGTAGGHATYCKPTCVASADSVETEPGSSGCARFSIVAKP